MFRLGTVSEKDFNLSLDGKLRLPTLHSANFAPDPQPTIQTGVLAMTEAALELFKSIRH